MKRFKNPVEVWGDTHNIHERYQNSITSKLRNAIEDKSKDIDLFIAIIIKAAKDRDFDFLHSEACEMYCDVIELNYVRVIRLLEKICDCLDFDKEIDLNAIHY